MEKITFTDIDTKEQTSFYVLCETTFGGEDYLLVTDLHPDSEDALAYIMRVTGESDADMTYEEVEDQKLLSILSGIFEELLEDTSLK